MIIELNFEKISKTLHEMFHSGTPKIQPVNLSETSRHTACVHQKAADSLQSF